MVNKVLRLILRLLDLTECCRVALRGLEVLSAIISRAILFDLISLGKNFVKRSEDLIVDKILIDLTQVFGTARAREHASRRVPLMVATLALMFICMTLETELLVLLDFYFLLTEEIVTMTRS